MYLGMRKIFVYIRLQTIILLLTTLRIAVLACSKTAVYCSKISAKLLYYYSSIYKKIFSQIFWNAILLQLCFIKLLESNSSEAILLQFIGLLQIAEKIAVQCNILLKYFTYWEGWSRRLYGFHMG